MIRCVRIKISAFDISRRHSSRFLLQALAFLAGSIMSVPALAQEQPAAVVDMTDALQFDPDPVEIVVGDTIEWRNTSNVPHTVTADADLANDPSYVSLPEGAEPFHSGTIAPGATFSRAFTVAGEYDYFCLPHQDLGMRGTVIVRAADDGGSDPGLADPIPESITLSDTRVRLAPVLEGLVAPNWGTHAPGLTTRLFVVDQVGQVHSLDLATGQSSVFLDVGDRLVDLGVSGPNSFDERGLLGLAFHPDYQSNGLLYTYTSEPAGEEPDFSTMPAGSAPNHQSVVTEWQVPTPGDPAGLPDPQSAREVLRIDQPQFNHDAGALVFDADKLLLIALGDGGNADDQGTGHGDSGNAQDTSNPLGAILRIDPLGRDSASGQYGIPTTNPFFGQPDFIEEIYAYGFRNPFRISIDPDTNELWAADAGQNDIEEVDRVTAGGNYGWNFKEGSFFFDPNGDDAGFVTDEPPAGGVPADLVDPVAEYDHDEGIAVVGGFVYRGSRVPDLAGRYVFGDYGSSDGGRLFVLGDNDQIQELSLDSDSGFTRRLLGFGRDAEGELYVLANETGTPFGETGVVLRIEAGPGTVGFESASVAVNESDGQATVTVVRTGGGGGAASVDYQVSGGSAAEGSDYELSAETLSWLDGEEGPKTITIDIIQDAADEPTESIELTLVNASGASLGSASTATVSITDDDESSDGGGSGAIGGWLGALLLGLVVLAGRRYASRRSLR